MTDDLKEPLEAILGEPPLLKARIEEPVRLRARLEVSIGIPSSPPEGKKQIQNIFWDPSTEELVFTVQD
jgi:hypothetical protein